MDSGKLFGMGWKTRVSLEEGLREAYADFLQKHHKWED
jgi:GDP-L-fucose synthase